MRAITTCVALLLASSAAFADEQAPTTSKTEYSTYERETLAAVLAEERGEVDVSPEGKVVESVDVVRLEVLEDRDPVPKFFIKPLNSVHTTSKEWIIRREVLIREGEPFRMALLDETERNLRRLGFQVSLVIGVPLKGQDPNKVRVLVVTKDVWSLRMNYELALTAGGLESLVLRPSETNLFGLHHTASLLYAYAPETHSFGVGYKVPRFGTSLIGATTSVTTIVNQRTGNLEGSTGLLSVGQPLYTTRTPWAWGIDGSWTDNVYRRYSKAKVFAFDSKKTTAVDAIPFQYNQQAVSLEVSGTRSFGWRNKHDVSLGASAENEAYQPFNLSAFDPVAADDFRSRLPRTDRRVGPFAQYHTYTTNFHRITDFETLALQEDYRLGPDAYVRAYPVAEALGSSRSFFGVFGSAQLTLPMGDGLTRFSLSSTTEAQSDKLADASVEGRLRIVTPRFGIGRVVFDAGALSRYRNYLNRQTILGGDTRLRGYPTRFFQGQDFVVYNLEYRSRPIHIWTLAVGGTIFYDVGDTMDGFENLRPKQSTGVGLRVLIPQFNRIVWRADLGFPLTRPLPTGVDPVSFFVTFEPAFAFGTAGP